MPSPPLDVTLLRQAADSLATCGRAAASKRMHEAADEIERLRKELAAALLVRA